MSKKQKRHLIQKLLGLVLIIAVAFNTNWSVDTLAAVIGIPVACCLMFSKKLIFDVGIDKESKKDEEL